jgi:ABC-type sugar transport system ATPase subunit
MSEGQLASGPSSSIPPRLHLIGISKTFPGVRALDAVELVVAPGQIHALVGENGAGKSTLMNIVAGVYRPDTGSLEMDGAPVAIADENAAARLGIAMIHQEHSLAPRLTVAENIYGGTPLANGFGILDWAAMHRQSAALLRRLDAAIDTHRSVNSLSPAQRQMVEIAKGLTRPLRLLILDEPTAALTLSEAAHLFEVMRSLANSGTAVLYVSHRLGEVFEVASRVTVLKDGRVTGVRAIGEIGPDQLIQLMVGRELSFAPDPRRAAVDADVVLEVEHLVAPPVQDASLTVRAGEIVCLAGLVGAGRTELCEAIFGARAILSGRVEIGGRDLRARVPAEAVRAGIGMVPEERKEAGLFLRMDVVENVAAASLSEFSTAGVISWARLRAATESFATSLRIKTPSVRQKVMFLSGGNQQKVVLARWLLRRPRLLIVDEPTRGVDVGAKAEIYRILRDLAEAGTAILMVSSDLPEVLALAHRIIVMSEGRIAGEISATDADELAILRLAAPKPVTDPIGAVA